jgi:arylsulfatase A-like enzyme
MANPSNASQKAWPIPPGGIQPQPAAVYDLFPTILALAGGKAPAEHPVDGWNLARMFSGKSDPSYPDTFLMHYPHAPHRCDYFTTWREGNWKVIYHYFPGKSSDGSHYQLFNLADDPFEQADLAKSKPGELRRLMEGMVARLGEQKATYPVDNSAPVKPVVP